jgi:hypothetical protein
MEKKILGYTDEVTTCDCCGKVDLKGTYAIDFEGAVSYYGSICAFKIHAVTDDEQKEAKKIFTKRLKASKKLASMEAEYQSLKSEHRLNKMYRFIESKGLDIMAFIKKYGKVVEENDFYTAYATGSIVKIVNK